MEVEAASAMAFGSQAQKDAASQRIFVDSTQAQPNIIKCIIAPEGMQHMTTLLNNFEQLAGLVCPDGRWNSLSCLKSVELELAGISQVIDSWGICNPAKMTGKLKVHLKHENTMSGGSKIEGVADDGGSATQCQGVHGPSGIASMRSLEFITTKQEVIDCENFMEALDVMLASNSKVWLLKAVRQTEGVSVICCQM